MIINTLFYHGTPQMHHSPHAHHGGEVTLVPWMEADRNKGPGPPQMGTHPSPVLRVAP